MKIILFFRILLVIAIGFVFNDLAYTQTDSKGLFAGISLQASSVNRGFGIVVGLSGGYKYNSGVFVGLELYDLLNGTPFPCQQDVLPENIRKSKMHFGGINLGYELFSEGHTSLSLSTLIGPGDISAYTLRKNESGDNSIYFVAMPKLSMSFQNTGDFRLFLDAGYRFPSGVNTSGTDDNLLGGAFVGISGVYRKQTKKN